MARHTHQMRSYCALSLLCCLAGAVEYDVFLKPTALDLDAHLRALTDPADPRWGRYWSRKRLQRRHADSIVGVIQ